jgi:hypothetical protein
LNLLSTTRIPTGSFKTIDSVKNPELKKLEFEVYDHDPRKGVLSGYCKIYYEEPLRDCSYLKICIGSDTFHIYSYTDTLFFFNSKLSNEFDSARIFLGNIKGLSSKYHSIKLMDRYMLTTDYTSSNNNNIYPVPSKHEITINLNKSTNKESNKLILYTLNGDEVYQITLANLKTQKVKLPIQLKGIFICMIVDQTHKVIASKKIIVN